MCNSSGQSSPNGNLLGGVGNMFMQNIAGTGQGGFFNNFLGGIFGGRHWTDVGKGFAGEATAAAQNPSSPNYMQNLLGAATSKQGMAANSSILSLLAALM